MIIDGENMENAKTRIELRNIHNARIDEMVKLSVKELSKSLDMSKLKGA